MRRLGLTGSFWPSEREELLLRAALLSGDRAMNAWEATERWLDIDRLPGDALRILPLLHHNLRELGVRTPIMPRLQGLYRRTWFVNQFVLARAREIIGALDEAGIGSLILKGAAIAQRYYGDVGLRPMGDLDVLVAVEDVGPALERLRERGWERELASLPPDELVRRAHGVALSNGSPVTCDLHWTVLEDLLLGPAPDPTEELWSGAVELELGEVRTRALGPTDQLLHVLAHGARPAPEARLQWIADAMMLLRGAEIDWRRLTDLAIGIRATIPVADALWYLGRRFAPVEVPPEPIARLRAAPVAPVERIAYAIAGGAIGGRLGLFPVNVARYARATHGTGTARRVAGFPRHLQRLWGLDSVGEVPGAVAERVGAALRGSSAPVHGIQARGSLEGHHELGVAPGFANGIRIDPVNPMDVARLVSEFVECGRSHSVNFVSADPTVLARRDPELRGALQTADLNLPDGASIAAALRLSGHHAQRTTGSDALLMLARAGIERSFRHYLFGGHDGVAEMLRIRLESAVPGVKVVGVETPPMGSVSTWDLAGVAERARAAGAHLLWIGVGTPKQQLAADRLRHLEAAPVILGVGAAFDFVSGAKTRAPLWMRRSGLEWLGRMIDEPGRLWRRYLIGNLAFARGVAGDLLAGPGSPRAR